MNNENGLNKNIVFNEEDVASHEGIAAWIYNKEENTILTMWHNKFGFWTVPMGKTKHDETNWEALLGEMKDELGIDVKKAKEFAKFRKTYKRSLPGEDKVREVKTLQHAYFIEEYTGEIRNMEPDKHREIKWMKVEDLEKETNVSDAVKYCFKPFKEYINKLTESSITTKGKLNNMSNNKIFRNFLLEESEDVNVDSVFTNDVKEVGLKVKSILKEATSKDVLTESADPTQHTIIKVIDTSNGKTIIESTYEGFFNNSDKNINILKKFNDDNYHTGDTTNIKLGVFITTSEKPLQWMGIKTHIDLVPFAISEWAQNGEGRGFVKSLHVNDIVSLYTSGKQYDDETFFKNYNNRIKPVGNKYEFTINPIRFTSLDEDGFKKTYKRFEDKILFIFSDTICGSLDKFSMYNYKRHNENLISKYNIDLSVLKESTGSDVTIRDWDMSNRESITPEGGMPFRNCFKIGLNGKKDQFRMALMGSNIIITETPDDDKKLKYANWYKATQKESNVFTAKAIPLLKDAKNRIKNKEEQKERAAWGAEDTIIEEGLADVVKKTLKTGLITTTAVVGFGLAMTADMPSSVMKMKKNLPNDHWYVNKHSEFMDCIGSDTYPFLINKNRKRIKSSTVQYTDEVYITHDDKIVYIIAKLNNDFIICDVHHKNYKKGDIIKPGQFKHHEWYQAVYDEIYMYKDARKSQNNDFPLYYTANLDYYWWQEKILDPDYYNGEWHDKKIEKEWLDDRKSTGGAVDLHSLKCPVSMFDNSGRLNFIMGEQKNGEIVLIDMRGVWCGVWHEKGRKPCTVTSVYKTTPSDVEWYSKVKNNVKKYYTKGDKIEAGWEEFLNESSIRNSKDTVTKSKE